MDSETTGKKVDDSARPLYANADVSVGTTVTMLLAFITKHKLKGDIVTDLVELINVLIDSKHGTNLKVHTVMSFVDNMRYKMTKHYYCSKCHVRIADSDSKICDTENCQANFEHQGSKEYFVTLPLSEQLERLLGVQENLNAVRNVKCRDDAVVTDIHDGKLYKKLLSDFQLDLNAIFHVEHRWCECLQVEQLQCLAYVFCCQ